MFTFTLIIIKQFPNFFTLSQFVQELKIFILLLLSLRKQPILALKTFKSAKKVP